MTLTLTSSLESFSRLWRTASTEPWTSAFTMISSSFISPWLMDANKLSSVTLWNWLNSSSLASRFLCSTNSRAKRSSETASKVSPACGTSTRPVISTGTDGPAVSTRCPRSLVITRTRPTDIPATIVSPVFKVPFCTSSVATGPRPLSRRASMTIPLPARLGFAFSSFSSATKRMDSSSLSIFICVLAETGTQMTSPPHSSGINSYSVSCCIILSGDAPGLSILLIATMMLMFAAFAWLIASTVCGMIPSSAATTKTAISVACAPRARIEVNAAWPGVSKNVIFCPSTSTRYAPMCWVMPPASVSVTAVWRIASKREVLPWST